jgi:phosphopantothenoylcysteine decarboxylase/phosphopantothenate--cysteine ligase
MHVRTAREMRDKVFENLSEASIIVKAAAVADFHLSKVPRAQDEEDRRLSLELDPTPDILAELGRKKGDRLLVGFAAETENLQQETRRKLEAKNCDMVVGNLVGRKDGPSNPTKTKCCWRCAPAKPFPCRAPPNAKWPIASSTKF